MSRTLYADAQRVFASLIAGPIAIAGLAFVVVASFAYCAGKQASQSDARLAARIDTVRIADSSAKVRTDTVTIYRAAAAKARASSDSAKHTSDSLDAKVGIASDSTVIVHDTVAVIPSEVIDDLRGLRLTVAKQDTTIQQQDGLILSLYQRDTTRLWQIASRDKLIRELSKPKCGKRCGLVIGFTAGIILHKVSK